MVPEYCGRWRVGASEGSISLYVANERRIIPGGERERGRRLYCNGYDDEDGLKE